ncbi:MAG: 50S ribosomal protein L25/general stress protein Ctc [Chlamydiota bacterium]|nr:50S ribosomal protein L25/general stress protein Ctc [Chlamydiota bacterium]
MKLTVSKRNSEKKSEAKQQRRNGNIPAVLYSSGNPGEAITIDGREFNAHLNQIKKGHLPTTVFVLTDADGKERKAIIKDIQYHVTTYSILHLDFEELHDDSNVNVKVPIELTGVADCVGIKLGGVPRQVIRFLRVNCLPKDIPSSFKLDITPLKMKEKRKLHDIVIPEGVKPLASNMNEVVVVIAKR